MSFSNMEIKVKYSNAYTAGIKRGGSNEVIKDTTVFQIIKENGTTTALTL